MAEFDVIYPRPTAQAVASQAKLHV